MSEAGGRRASSVGRAGFWMAVIPWLLYLPVLLRMASGGSGFG